MQQVIGVCLGWFRTQFRSMFLPNVFENAGLCKTERTWGIMGNYKQEDIGPLSLSMVSLKRTGGEPEGTGNTTHIVSMGAKFEHV